MRKEGHKVGEYAIIELPVAQAGRFIRLPDKDGKNYLMYLDDVVRYCLPLIFHGMNYKHFEAYAFKFTKDAEMEIDNDLRNGMMQKISKGVKSRKRGEPLRVDVYKRQSLVLSVLLTGWAILFYFTVMDEVNDEVDDSLEDYSEIIIIRALAGEELPSKNTASNNQYFLREVTKEYAGSRDDILYKDSMVYIPEKDETEPARILTTIFKDDGEKFFELTVATPSIEKDDLKDAMAGWMIFLYIALLLTIIVINVWVFYRNMRPLYVLLHWLDKYRIGKGNEPLQNNTRVSEFRKLNEAAVRYAERSEQMFEQQKQFIGNASHEMQTPLAICRNRLEMLMEDENLSESQLEELMKTHQTLEHITKLNKSLLLLSKIENGQSVSYTHLCNPFL